MLYYFKKGKNATEMKKRFVQWVDKVLWLIENVKSGLWSFVLEISHWTMFCGWVEQLKLSQIKTLIENNQHSTTWVIDNILKISKSIKLLVKMKSVFYFMEKTK